MGSIGLAIGCIVTMISLFVAAVIGSVTYPDAFEPDGPGWVIAVCMLAMALTWSCVSGGLCVGVAGCFVGKPVSGLAIIGIVLNGVILGGFLLILLCLALFMEPV